jgi:ribosomal protein RSM22 (predicted rRNA methylase)
VSVDLPPDLRAALAAEFGAEFGAMLGAVPAGQLGPAVERLIARYRLPDAPATEPILAGPVEVAAYAAYRMPATYAAVRAVLTQVAAAVPTLEPTSLLDVGGGTGAAAWAATDVFAGLREVSVLDQVAGALELGCRLGQARPALRRSSWRQWRVGDTLPSADLVTVSYVLGELPPARRPELVAAAAEAAGLLVVVEPGTPPGYGHIRAARDTLLAAGWHVVAPCPHDSACPIAREREDWCHFAVRVNRSAMHRRAKGATLGYEDEKFAYVAATRTPALTDPAARVLRHPVKRKGLVQLRLCTPSGAATDEIVSQRQGARYRAARDVEWGDPWPPQSR